MATITSSKTNTIEEKSPIKFPGFIGKCNVFLEVVKNARLLAPIDRPILIRGERGTGKELFAKFIHLCSKRAKQNLEIVNSAAINTTLTESDLFGHEKGAFTDAIYSRKGHFEVANNGTLFLDEIGKMDIRIQEKLLRVIEYQQFKRVGGTDFVKVDVRIIAATNSDLEKEMNIGQFLPDLYDRLRFGELRVPSLRDRREDIPEFIFFFIENFHNEVPELKKKKLTKSAIKMLQNYHWPGNIRELKRTVESIYLLNESEQIGIEALPPEIVNNNYSSVKEPEGFYQKMNNYEYKLIFEALKSTNGNQTDAARLLKITYAAFRHRYSKHLNKT